MFSIFSLGDRHAENILFDKTNGDCIHVDLNMLFDQGASLNVPECVPFRLTQNLIDAMGPTGYKGTFTRTCEITMNVLLLNKEALLSVFSTLANDNFSVSITHSNSKDHNTCVCVLIRFMQLLLGESFPTT